MIIRKKFGFKGSHIVRNCSSERCKKSIHSHSYSVEVFFKSNRLDNGQMVYDFGLTKGTIKDIVSSFNNAYSVWNKETEEFQNFIKSSNARYILMPVSPSAEMYSLMFYYIIDQILRNTAFNNGEGAIQLHSVRVHETATGYAESFREDVRMWNFSLEDIVFSQQIKDEWKDPEMYDKLKNHITFKNPTVELTH